MTVQSADSGAPLPTTVPASREALDCLLKTTTSGFLFMDAEGVIQVGNESYCQSSGHSMAELVGMRISDLDATETAQDSRARIEQLKAAGSLVFESQHRRKDGSLWDVEVSTSYLPGGEGHIIAFFRDITEQKEASTELTRQLDINQRVFNATDAHLAVVARDGTILAVNQAWARFAGENDGWDSSTWGIGAQYFRPLRPTCGDTTSAAEAYGGVRAVMSGDLPHFSVEYPCDHPDGTGRWFQLRVYPLDDQEGTVLVSHENITDQKMAMQEVIKVEKLESLGVLAGGIAHDFNNVLTGVIGHLSLAQAYLDPDHPAFEALARAEQASFRAEELARQLLTFARGGAPVKSDVSVRRLVDESVALVLRGSRVRALVDIPPNIHKLRADAGQISQAFHNLILNAKQAMAQGGTLRISAANVDLATPNALELKEGQYVRLEFKDDGPGIDPETLARIFDPYFTTKDTGNGLGLASVYSIACRHGGAIKVESAPGRGARFIIHIPATARVADGGSEGASRDLELGNYRGTALVMDDDDIVRSLALSMLRRLGFDVVVCEDGEQAVMMYQDALKAEAPYAFAILDLTVPGGVGGQEAAERILALDPEATLIVSSGYSNDPVLAEHKAHGIAAGLAKPFDLKRMQQTLDALLPQRHGN